jgi:hypothetical protein
MCPQPAEDYTYAAYGGLIQRADMMHGRVGSAFAPAEGVPGAIHDPGPGTIHEHDGAYPEPALMSPEGNVAPQPLGGAANQPTGWAPDQSQAETAAFDPGDILSSGPQ